MALACSLLVVTVIIKVIKEVKAVNLVKGQEGKYCTGSASLQKLFDGDRSHILPASMPEKCDSSAYLTVDLGGEYDIHYVFVYEGSAPDSLMGRMDFFTICMEDLCFGHPDPVESFESEIGIRVNVDFDGQLHSSFKLSSRMNEGLFISEIEAYTLASGQPGQRAMIHRGCFAQFGVHSIEVVTDVLHRCQNSCGNLRFQFFGIKENKLCSCGNEYDEGRELSTETCNVKCSDGETYCGGIESYSVYLVLIRLPTFIGCFQTISKDNVSITLNNMTVTLCLLHCSSYQFAMLEGGKTCFCGNDETLLGKEKYDGCMESCPGNTNMHCGGSDHAAKYQTCYRHRQSSAACSMALRCSDEMDVYGKCHSSCKRGFKNDYCMERDFVDVSVTYAALSRTSSESISLVIKEANEGTSGESIDSKDDPIIQETTPRPTGDGRDFSKCNPQFCNDEKNTECITYRGRARCACKTGFGYKEENICRDIDECELEACDLLYTTCNNSVGSYTCECNPGYRKVADDICSAIGKNLTKLDIVLMANEHLLKIIIASLAIPLVCLVMALLTLRKKESESDISN